MKASAKWIIGAAGVLALALGLAAVLRVFPFEDEAEAGAPEDMPALEDGEWFAWVIVGEDETSAPTLGVDLADMLTGEEAKKAAIEDGVIGEGEDLPNDFYIDNPEIAYELLHLADGVQIRMLAAEDHRGGSR